MLVADIHPVMKDVLISHKGIKETIDDVCAPAPSCCCHNLALFNTPVATEPGLSNTNTINTIVH